MRVSLQNVTLRKHVTQICMSATLDVNHQRAGVGDLKIINGHAPQASLDRRQIGSLDQKFI